MSRVLIVEDDPDTAYTLATLVSQLDCSIYMAASGSEALQLAELHQPDYLLLDLMMPRMDGYEAAHRLRQDYGYKGKIVAVTAIDRDDAKLEAAGIDDYLRKPVLLATLARVLSSPAV